MPTHSVTVLDGLKAEFPNAKIQFVPGTQFLRNDGDPVPDKLLTTPDSKPGLKADYGSIEGMDLSPRAKPTPLTSRVEPNIDLTAAIFPRR
jgi:beta-glucosidase